MASGLSSARLEEVALGTAAGLALMLLAVKAWFSHDHRMRRAAASGYHQRDVARYSSDGVGHPVEGAVDRKSRPLAPSFAAPVRGGRNPGGSARLGTSRHGIPAGTSPPLGTFDPVTNLVRAFDTEEAWRQRPATPIPTAIVKTTGPPPAAGSPQVIPDLEVEEEIEEIPPPAGALPLLVQPPPPPDRDEHPKAG